MRNKVQDTPLNRPRYLSEKIELVPDQLTKLLYRKGEGQYPQKGDIVYAQYVAYQMNGRQIENRAGAPSKFMVGIGRLIEGLEIGLSSCRKHEKFTLLIGPELGYKNMVLHKEEGYLCRKLVMEMEIVDIYKPSNSEIQENDLLALFHTKYKQALTLLETGKLSEGYEVLSYCNTLVTNSSMNSSSSNKHSELESMVTQKRATILIELGRCQEAFDLLKVKPFNQTQQYVIYLRAEALMKSGEREKAISEIKQYYKLFGEAGFKQKRKYIEFLLKHKLEEQIEDLSGYNYENDVITNLYETKKEEPEPIMRRRMIHPFFRFYR